MATIEVTMETYTAGTTPQNIIKSRLPHKYSMELNRSGMLMLLEALNQAWEAGNDAALSFRLDILTTIGIEEI